MPGQSSIGYLDEAMLRWYIADSAPEVFQTVLKRNVATWAKVVKDAKARVA